MFLFFENENKKAHTKLLKIIKKINEFKLIFFLFRKQEKIPKKKKKKKTLNSNNIPCGESFVHCFATADFISPIV
jgi:hypothetical protein